MKALHLLIHDLRAPLSVAQGYLRLLQQNRLEADADRQRAIAQTMDALGRIGRLCEDATAFVAEPMSADGPATTIQVRQLVEQVKEACAARGAPLTFVAEPERLLGAVKAPHLDRVVESLAVILWAVRRSTRDESVRVSVIEEEGKEAQFLLGCDEDRVALRSASSVPSTAEASSVPRTAEVFDPWRGGHGIALPLACRIVTEAGGRIWTCADGRSAVGIAFSEEARLHDGPSHNRR